MKFTAQKRVGRVTKASDVKTSKPLMVSGMMIGIVLVLLGGSPVRASVIFGASEHYNAFIYGNLTGNTGDVEGRLAVGGNASIPNTYSVGIAVIGSQLPQSSTRDDLIVRGTFTTAPSSSWAVLANAAYGSLSGGGVTHVSPGASSRVQAAITLNAATGNAVADGETFESIQSTLQDSSTFLGSLTTPGVSISEMFSDLTLTGTNAGLNVFNITASQWGSNSTRLVDAPVGSTVVINISGATINFSGGTMGSVGVVRNNILLNFFEATSLQSSGFAYEGSVLAPFTTTTAFNGGAINGQGFHGGNVTQDTGFEWHNFQFTGTLPIPEPTVMTFLLAAMGALALRRQRLV